jgi:hypothetical protein
MNVNVEKDLGINPSTPRSEARGMLSLPAGRQGLILSGTLNLDLKIEVWRRRTYQSPEKSERRT